MLLRPRFILPIIVLVIVSVVGTHKSSDTAEGEGSSNPWSKNYNPTAHQQASSHRGITIRTVRLGRGETVDSGELAERARDEEYRRKLLREMRRDHDEQYGRTDTDLSDY